VSEDGGGSRDVGEAGGDESAGTAFGGGDGEVVFLGKSDDGGFEARLIVVDEVFGEGGFSDLAGLGDGVWSADEAEVEFGDTGAVAEFESVGFGEFLKLGVYFILEVAFSDSGEFEFEGRGLFLFLGEGGGRVQGRCRWGWGECQRQRGLRPA